MFTMRTENSQNCFENAAEMSSLSQNKAAQDLNTETVL